MKENILDVLKNKILVLDGAFGTMIQTYGFTESDFRGRQFLQHPNPLMGFNDILNLSKPTAVKEIHLSYLKAGADIISTNTFNSNSVSMKDYGLSDIKGLVVRLNREGALLAKEAISVYEQEITENTHFVAGSIGPSNRSCTLSPDITDPLKRNITYDELYDAYKEQITGLLEGGVDLLLFETFFDTLNLKAGLAAANTLFKERSFSLPIMVSATVSDNSGRLLSGQTLEAFITSISHFDNVEIIGLNCGFGPDRMKTFIDQIHNLNTHFTSCHPNAGLPDELGNYDILPEEFIDKLKPLLEEKKLNIIGGCCGTTPEYIKKLSSLAKQFQPGSPKNKDGSLRLSGLDMVTVHKEFITVGERCNVAGSSKFLNLIKENAFEEAAEIAKNQIKKGASIIDINMDDPLIVAEETMVKFIRYLLAEPEIARLPFMIDSSKWNVIIAALKNIQGKGIVNSLSLKEGEEEFIVKARKVKELGFALMVMAFDEKGQADSFERKIEICKRAYNLLTKKCGFLPQDIIFDVNVMTIATGMTEHSRYAIDFIKAVEWIKKNLPGVKTSGGISNLSFAFRGKNKIREYMHIVFLHHARKAGLDMAIINPAQKTDYENIPVDIRNCIENVILKGDEGHIEQLIEFANNDCTSKDKPVLVNKKDVITSSIEEILRDDLMKGELKSLDEHIHEALKTINDPIKIIEGPLLEGMITVGNLFGEGKMFLPQVIKTARAMKKAVEILTPYITNRRGNKNDYAGKILIATVKGDVHDIGKNIVSTVLSCNNFEIIDLGIMVEGERIVEIALKEKPDIICLSGLITPSLNEMTETVKLLSEAGISVPVMVGGAATSVIHTALKINPYYKGIVLHMGDASQNPIVASKLLNPDLRDKYIIEINQKYKEITYNNKKKIKIVPYEKVISEVRKQKRNDFIVKLPSIKVNEERIFRFPIEEIIPFINWKMFFLAWKIQGSYIDTFPFSDYKGKGDEWVSLLNENERMKAKEALQLYETAQEILTYFIETNEYDGGGIVTFQPATGDLEKIKIGDIDFPMLRQQREDSGFLSCADYVGKKDSYIGLFAVTAGRKMVEISKDYEKEGDKYKSIIVQTLADRLAEASSEFLHHYVSEKIWETNLRPAWGYPMLPDQSLILQTESFISYEKIGIELTENGAMFPPSSISGIYLNKPEGKYFIVGDIGMDQMEEYALKRDLELDKVKSLLRQI